MYGFCFSGRIPYTARMQKDVLIMLLGAFVAFIPFLGFPQSWDTVFLVVAGVCMIGLGIAVRRGKKPPQQLPSYHNEQE